MTIWVAVLRSRTKGQLAQVPQAKAYRRGEEQGKHTWRFALSNSSASSYLCLRDFL